MLYIEAWEQVSNGNHSCRFDKSIPVSLKSLKGTTYLDRKKYKIVSYLKVVLATLHHVARMKSIQEWNSIYGAFLKLGQRGWLMYQYKHQLDQADGTSYVPLEPRDKSIEVSSPPPVKFRPLDVEGNQYYPVLIFF